MKVCRFLILITAALILLKTAGNGETGSQPDPGARISYVSGKSYIQRASSLEYQVAALGMRVKEGDRIGTTSGRMEIYLGNGNYIRLDHHSKIDFTRLPRGASRFTQLRLWSGSAIVSLRTLKGEKNLELNTPDVSAYFLDEGCYRLDVEEKKETIIHVFRGVLEAAGESDSLLLKKSQQASAVHGRSLRSEQFSAAVHDSFFLWNKDREEKEHSLFLKEKPSAPPAVYTGLEIKIYAHKNPEFESPISRVYKHITGSKSSLVIEKNPGSGKSRTRVKSPKKIRPPIKKPPPRKKKY